VNNGPERFSRIRLRSAGCASRDQRTLFIYRLALVTCVALSVGVVISWPAWGGGGRTFPGVPVSSVFEQLHPASSYLSAAIIVLTILLVLAPAMLHLAIAGVIILSIVLILIDINRFQPWVYLYDFILLGLLWGSRRNRTQDATLVGVLRVMLGGCYLWSGIHKVNLQYFTEVFPQLIQPVDAVVRLSDMQMLAIAAAGPALEIVIGAALICICKIKLIPVLCTALHLFLLFLLGPLGLNYNSVVWPWNIAMCFFVVMVCYAHEQHLSIGQLWRNKSYIPKLIITIFLILPGLRWFKKWDTYPSFALYAGFVTEGYLEFESPSDLQRAVPQHRKLDRHRDIPGVSIFFWSLYDLNLPAYPEERIYRAVHRQLCGDPSREADISLNIYARPRLFGRSGEVKTASCRNWSTK
jgi:hypothetical protein